MDRPKRSPPRCGAPEGTKGLQQGPDGGTGSAWRSTCKPQQGQNRHILFDPKRCGSITCPQQTARLNVNDRVVNYLKL